LIEWAGKTPRPAWRCTSEAGELPAESNESVVGLTWERIVERRQSGALA
jgi:hypothetical protein